MAELIVNLDEFAELAGVTSETMRVHLREMLKEVEFEPTWIVERGDRGRAYKLEAESGLAWWRSKREADESAGEERQAKLRQLRLDVVGENAETPDALALTGRQRRDEYAAAMDAIRYRKLLGQLVEKAELERVLTAAAVEHRRRLQQLPAEFGIVAGLPADQVSQLEGMLERAVDLFVTTITNVEAMTDGGVDGRPG